MQADTLAALLRQLDMAPAVIVGGSGGARASRCSTAARHPDVARALAVWWISGGTFGLLTPRRPLLRRLVPGGVDRWDGSGGASSTSGPRCSSATRPTASASSRRTRRPFIETMERWMMAYCPDDAELVPGHEPRGSAGLRSCRRWCSAAAPSDIHHTRATSERIADALPNARLVEPPWGDREWNERQVARMSGEADGLFVRWPLLVPQIQEWADEVL